VRPIGWALLLTLSAAARAAPRPPRVAMALDDEEEPSKKTAFLREKGERPDVRAAAPRLAAPTPVLTLRNVWTRESYPVPLPARPGSVPFRELTRCHFTNQAAAMDERLLDGILKAAAHFKAKTIEVVSGFRAPKYQLMLRKKGHEVARDSQHPLGHAVDFRLPGSSTNALYRFVRGLRVGGVGFYPGSAFVHADVGRVRVWRGR